MTSAYVDSNSVAAVGLLHTDYACLSYSHDGNCMQMAPERHQICHGRCICLVGITMACKVCSVCMDHFRLWHAGNFFSAAFEDHCKAVAGASGGIFGLLGLFIADMVLNFETLTR